MIPILLVLVAGVLAIGVRAEWPQLVLAMVWMGLAAMAVARAQAPGRVPSIAAWLVLPAMAGAIQLALRATVVPAATINEALSWLALGAVTVAIAQSDHHGIRHALAICGVMVVLLGLAHYYTADGRLYWIWKGVEPEIFGPFRSRNNFATFVCLILPLALDRAWSNNRIDVIWTLVSGILAASAVVCGSRAGAALAISEILVFAALWLWKDRRLLPIAIVATAAILVTALGWDTLAWKLQDADPFRHRRDIAHSVLEMITANPWIGLGLGSFAESYPRFARFDSGHFVNFAHNDWLETAVECGVPIALIIFILSVRLSLRALHHPWALGVPAACLHALVDYPFQRLGLAAWIVAIGTLLVRADLTKRTQLQRRREFRQERRPVGDPVDEDALVHRMSPLADTS